MQTEMGTSRTLDLTVGRCTRHSRESEDPNEELDRLLHYATNSGLVQPLQSGCTVMPQRIGQAMSPSSGRSVLTLTP